MTSTDFIDDFTQAVRDAANGANSTSWRADTERAYLATPAPNAIAWATGVQYLGQPELYNYTRSYQIIRDVFQLLCPVCNRDGNDCWGKSPEELKNEVLLEWHAPSEDDRCPSCWRTRTQLVNEGLLKAINQMHLVCGQRSGKSMTAAFIGTYTEHRVITMGLSHPRGLPGYLGLSVKDPFEMGFLASNEAQSQDTIWAKYIALRRESPWFQRFTTWVKDQEENQNTPPGMKRWRYNESSREILNEHPDIHLKCNSLNSNSSGLRGRTRIFAGVDEIAYMMSGDGRMSAKEIYEAMENSLQTVRSRAKLEKRPNWLGLIASVSSPKSVQDYSMELLKKAPDISGMLAYHYATWEYNPYEPRENFDSYYEKDPVAAEKNFGANPPLAAHPLISDVQRFRDIVVDYELKPTARFNYPTFEEEGRRYITVETERVDLLHRGTNRFIAFDAGLNFDSFAGACAHSETLIDAETGSQRTITVFDWVIRILPMGDLEVYFDSLYAVCAKVRKSQPLVRVEFDQWNSAQLIQQIRRLGVRAEKKGLKSEDYIKFRADAHDGLIKMLPPRASDLNARGEWAVSPTEMAAESCALYEIESLERDPITGKVTNRLKGQRQGYNSNDVAEVIVHVHKMVQESGYSEKDDDRSRKAARARSEAESSQFIANNMGGVYNVRRAGGGHRDWSKGPGGRGW